MEKEKVTKEKMKFASDWLAVFSFVVSVVLTIGLFCISNDLNDRAEENKKTQYTVVWANDIFYRVDQAVSKIVELEEPDKEEFKNGTQKRNYEYVSGNREMEKHVFTVLNQYSALGLAVENKHVDVEQVQKLRSQPIVETWSLYKAYIEEYRTKKKRENPKLTGENRPWAGFESLYNAMKR